MLTMLESYSLNLKGKLYALDRPKIMGILNVTPDSFFDGGKHNSLVHALQRAEMMLHAGADFLDIGGYSSRPGAEEVSLSQELERVIAPIEAIKKQFPNSIISIDTFRAEVARQAVAAGADMVNDISAGEDDENMFAAVKDLQVPYIIMHKQGTPKTMQQNPQYSNVVVEVTTYLSKRALQLHEMGINDVIIDPGFGFGKTLEHNYELLRHLDHFQALDLPILVGVSRKSMINKVLGTQPKNALNGTTALHMAALQKGAHILRVHDVREAVQVSQLWEHLKD